MSQLSWPVLVRTHWHYTPAVTAHVLVIVDLRRIYETRIWVGAVCGVVVNPSPTVSFTFTHSLSQPVAFDTTTWCCRLSVIWLDLFCRFPGYERSTVVLHKIVRSQRSTSTWDECTCGRACDARNKSSRSYTLLPKLSLSSHLLFAFLQKGHSRRCHRCQPES